MMSDSRIFQAELDHLIEQWTELFPAEIHSCYQLHGKRGSKKPAGFAVQRIKLIEQDTAQTFKDETGSFCPEYQPKTVNLDGWTATQNSWRSLFPMIVVIECILHAFISIRSRCKKKCKQVWPEIQDRFWDIYQAETDDIFLTALADFHQWPVPPPLKGHPAPMSNESTLTSITIAQHGAVVICDNQLFTGLLDLAENAQHLRLQFAL